MAQFELWLLQRQLHQLTPATASQQVVTCFMDMLASAATKAAELALEGHDMSGFEAACQAARARLEAVAAQRALEQAREQTLVLPDSQARLLQEFRAPEGVVPEQLRPQASQSGLDAARQRAARALGSLAIGPSMGTPLPEVLQQLKGLLSEAKAEVALQHALRSTERQLFARAAASFNQPGSAVAEQDLPLLEQVVDACLTALQELQASGASKASMQVELRSRGVLVAWVAYCTAWQATRGNPVLRQYGVALQWQELRHLVLDDRLATDAALAVAAYLQQHSLAGREAFSLRDGGAATFRLAEQYAAACPTLTSILEQQQQDARQRVEEHWQEVQRKQRRVQELREDRDRVNDRLATARQKLTSLRYGTSAYDRQDEKVDDLKEELSSLESKLKRKGKPPAAVIQPLPEAPALARRWLFFLHMPAPLRSLSRLSFLAQQLLLPLPLDEHSAKAVMQPWLQTSLHSHYVQHQHSRNVPGEGRVMLRAPGAVPSSDEIGPGHVDNMRSDRDGVWWPDQLAPAMVWEGSGCAAADAMLPSLSSFNPFAAVPATAVELSFTEQLLKQDQEALQWALHAAGSREATLADRGNLPMAKQDSKPAWLSKAGFLAFGSLRSYPLGQHRRLCSALSQRCWPLAEPAVQALVRQSLYHLGQLQQQGNGDGFALLWRTGWQEEGGILPTLCSELEQLAEELEQAPREHEQLLLLGEVAAFLSCWHEPGRPVARRFAAMSSQAAAQLQEQVDAAEGRDEMQARLQAKQTKARMLALLCHACGQLSSADVAEMLQLMVRGSVCTACHSQAFVSHPWHPWHPWHAWHELVHVLIRAAAPAAGADQARRHLSRGPRPAGGPGSPARLLPQRDGPPAAGAAGCTGATRHRGGSADRSGCGGTGAHAAQAALAAAERAQRRAAGELRGGRAGRAPVLAECAGRHFAAGRRPAWQAAQ